MFQHVGRSRSSVYSIAFAVIVLLLTLAACGGGAADNSAATVTALAQALGGGAATAEANVPTVETTPAVPTPPPDDAVATAASAATAVSIAQEGTRSAAATAEVESAGATATVLAPIQAELPTYGIDPNDYRLAHVYAPVTLEVEGYRQYTYDENFVRIPVRDFVMAADMTWTTRFGFAGCGFVVRSNADLESLNQYMIFAIRYGDGRVLFTVVRDGNADLNEVVNTYAPSNDPSFDWRNDTTNRLAVVGRGDTFSIYGNGSKLVDIQATAGFLEGAVSFVALNESGTTRCEFTNAWLWLLN
jgi:hypothetical protein